MSQANVLGRPAETEFAEYYGLYINRVPDGSIVDLLHSQIAEFRSVLESISEEEASVLHEPYTWTIKQVVGHLIDVERAFAYRALRFACGDLRPILGMEHDQWMDNSDYVSPTLAALTGELSQCRSSNVSMFRRFKPEAFDNRAEVDGNEMTVRALGYCLVGHIIHHLEIVKSRVS